MIEQHIMYAAQFFAAGGQPTDGYPAGERTVVIVGVDDGRMVWTSWAEDDVDPLERVNPDAPFVDHRESACR